MKIPKAKTAAQIKKGYETAATNLPVETKRIFWKAMIEDGKNIGEAKKIAGIDDVMIASSLVIQLHTTHHRPMRVRDIK